MEDHPIIIVGTGAAGLIAARELLRKGRKVILLEARDRAGGRIFSLHDNEYTLEAGAEFVHGDQPLTLGLLKEYGIEYIETAGSMERKEDEKEKKVNVFVDHWGLLIGEMKKVRKDIPLAQFLSHHFAGDKYEELRRTVRGFAEGFDLADMETVSTMGLYKEWGGDEEETQYRIKGGYGNIIDGLVNDCAKMGSKIKFKNTVKIIEWEKSNVRVYAHNGKEFAGSKILVTVPLGILKSESSDQAAISFSPSIPQEKCKHDIGYGSVIKIILECNTAFWEKKWKKASYIFSNEPVPTWWTQLPGREQVFTGWVGSSMAKILESKSADEILQIAYNSLANIFNELPALIRSYVLKAHVFNWSKDPFSMGGYSFPTVATKEARKIFNTPVEDTIYFAGEAFYEGPTWGTVEAALKSGLDAAKKIIKI